MISFTFTFGFPWAMAWAISVQVKFLLFSLVLNRRSVNIVPDEKPRRFLNASIHIHKQRRIFHIMFNVFFRKRYHIDNIKENRVSDIIPSCNFFADYQAIHRSRTNLKLIVYLKVLCTPNYSNDSITGFWISYCRKANFGGCNTINYQTISIK
jgi:hypothetical protein